MRRRQTICGPVNLLSIKWTTDFYHGKSEAAKLTDEADRWLLYAGD